MAKSSAPREPLQSARRNNRFVAALSRPLRNFLKIQAAGGILLLVATVAALIWANSPYGHVYEDILSTQIDIAIGSHSLLHLSVQAFVNDALMALFFFVVGLEIKREIVVGTLRKPRAAALPAIAAVGGMVCPALIYFAFNAGTPASNGWGIPMATDIAFAVGVVSLLGTRVPSGMKIFLLSLAIVDDIGAITVIAIFYTSNLSGSWLLGAVASIVVVIIMRRMRIAWTPAYLMVGIFLWYAVHESGVHSTIAGVILGLLAPARPLNVMQPSEEQVLSALRGDANANLVRHVNVELKDQVSVVERLEDLLHPVSSFLIVPIFALANAGIELSTETLSSALTSRVTIGVALGLIFGNVIGITIFTWVSVKSKLTSLPPTANWGHVWGVAATAGIGFTVSIFIAGLAFTGPELVDAKIGILVASIVAACVGSLILWRAGHVHEIETDDPRLVGTAGG